MADTSADIIVLDDKDSKDFFAVLTCNQSDATKILRQSEADCALKAVSAMVAGLQKDTVLLFSMFSCIGDLLDDTLNLTRGQVHCRIRASWSAGFHEPEDRPVGIIAGQVRPRQVWPAR
jgi:hypothetical protein